MDIGSIAGIEPVQGFAGNDTYRLRSGTGETFYWKSGAREAIDAEVWACARARKAGVLAPLVVTSALEPTAYLVSQAIPGEPSSDEAVLEQAGEQLRRLHAVDPRSHRLLRRGNGYGFLHEGLRDSWAAVLRKPIEDLEALGDIVPPSVARSLRQLDGFDALYPGSPALLHGDLHPRHVYAEGKQFTGFIDWGDAAFGDPLFDLGRFSRAGTSATDALLRGYAIERTPELDRTLALYRVLWSLMAMHWELAAGGDWFAAHIEAIEADLQLLS